MTQVDNKILAAEGKVLIRKSDKINFGKEYYLGMTYYQVNSKLPVPFMEIASDFEEVDPTSETDENLN